MQVTGVSLLADLRGHGLRIALGVDGLLHVGPAASITESLDGRIRSGRDQLLQALQVERSSREDLQRRIREMAQRWEYTEEDLAEALAAAEADPLHWSLACQFDEEAAARGRKVGRGHPWG